MLLDFCCVVGSTARSAAPNLLIGKAYQPSSNIFSTLKTSRPSQSHPSIKTSSHILRRDLRQAELRQLGPCPTLSGVHSIIVYERPRPCPRRIAGPDPGCRIRLCLRGSDGRRRLHRRFGERNCLGEVRPRLPRQAQERGTPGLRGSGGSVGGGRCSQPSLQTG